MGIIKPWTAKPEIIFERNNDTIVSENTITVCITNYNYSRFIIECLDSIMNQTFENLELIVIDDVSSDNSIAVISKWMKKNNRRFQKVMLLKNSTNQGPSSSRNIAINMASGANIMIVDADNSLYPSAISKLMTAHSLANVAGVYSQIEIFGNCKSIGYADIWDDERLRIANYVDVMALIKKEAWEQVSGFTHIEEGWEDYDFWLKFVDAGLELAYLPQILCRYRVHGDSRTATEAHVSHDNLNLIMKYRHSS